MGSPPPMRGKVVPLGVVTVLSRITPAYAGKSSQDYSTEPFRLRITPAYAGKSAVPLGTDQMRRDHPRLCGEKQHPMAMWFPMTGSPPPMRGKG